MIKAVAHAILFLILASSAALAQQEPWGGNVQGWTFTQAQESGVDICRAIQGQNLIARDSKGKSYVSVPAPAGLPTGWYKEGRASIIIGGAAEPIDASVTGRLLFYVDDSHYAPLSRARGYQWRVSGPKGVLTGSVSFSGDVARAIAEMRACLKANAAASQPRPTPSVQNSNAKWSGAWSWVRPLVFNFGSGPAAPIPGPQDVTVRKRVNATLELMPNNRAKICVDSNPCSVSPFSFGNGAYNIDYSSGFIAVVTNDQGRTLNGQMWFKKENRIRTTPDATFHLTR